MKAGADPLKRNSDGTLKIHDLHVFWVLYGSLKLVLERSGALGITKCKVYLMPLGGGVFGNNHSDIADSIKEAIYLLEKNYGSENISRILDIHVLTWKYSPEEYMIYSNLLG